MNNDIHHRYWRPSDYKRLDNARRFSDLAPIALDIIGRIPSSEIHMVSGPISTGGVGTVKGNMHVFQRVVEIMDKESDKAFFSQIPFQEHVVRIYWNWKLLPANDKQPYCLPILHDFYEPVFRSGRIHALHFIPGWSGSFGARWERDLSLELGISQFDVPVSIWERIVEEDSFEIY